MMSQQLLDAVKHNDLTRAADVIAGGADVNFKDGRGNSLLIVSAADGHADMVKLLLEAGADIHALDAGMKATALHAAAYLRHPEVMRILIDHGINIDAQGPFNGYTALHDAVWQNNVEGVSILFAAGADTSLQAQNGMTPLALAQQNGHKEIIDILSAPGRP
jgi:ankyrin repeat protein